MNRLGDVFAENPTDDSATFTEAEDRINAAALESDLISRARDNTDACCLPSAGFDDVTVTWRGGVLHQQRATRRVRQWRASRRRV